MTWLEEQICCAEEILDECAGQDATYCPCGSETETPIKIRPGRREVISLGLGTGNIEEFVVVQEFVVPAALFPNGCPECNDKFNWCGFVYRVSSEIGPYWRYRESHAKKYIVVTAMECEAIGDEPLERSLQERVQQQQADEIAKRARIRHNRRFR